MAGLVDVLGCWARFLFKHGVTTPQLAAERPINCAAGSITVDDWLLFERVSAGLHNEVPIYDGDTGFNYYQLTTATTVWKKAAGEVGCRDLGAGCGPPVGGGCPQILTSQPFGTGEVIISNQEVNLAAGGSGVNPATGQKYIGWSGVPVVAAVEVDGGDWLPIAVGLAADFTLASAKAACGLNGKQLEILLSFS